MDRCRLVEPINNEGDCKVFFRETENTPPEKAIYVGRGKIPAGLISSFTGEINEKNQANRIGFFPVECFQTKEKDLPDLFDDPDFADYK